MNSLREEWLFQPVTLKQIHQGQRTVKQINIAYSWWTLYDGRSQVIAELG